MFNITAGSAQIKGMREEQQDALGFTQQEDKDFIEHGGILAVIADGIGGHAHGKEASNRAVAAFVQHYAKKPRQVSIQEGLYHALIESNHAVLDFAETQGESENCGTTLVAAVLHSNSNSLYWIGVGDSRLYFFRDNELVQFTSDANYGGYLIRKLARGKASRDDLHAEENSHRLTSFLGVKKFGRIDRSIRAFPLQKGDKVLLCTDGIYQALSKGELIGFLSVEPKQACDRLIQAIVTKNLDHQDNATVVILAYGLKETPKIILTNKAGADPRGNPARQTQASKIETHKSETKTPKHPNSDTPKPIESTQFVLSRFRRHQLVRTLILWLAGILAITLLVGLGAFPISMKNDKASETTKVKIIDIDLLGTNKPDEPNKHFKNEKLERHQQ